MNLRFDLHSHSTHSDGLLTPSELVERAAQRGVDALALTDHDETGGLAEARAAARRRGIALIDGVEVSVSWHGHTLHVVGLNVDPRHAALAAGLQAVRDGRRGRAERIAADLERAGIAGSLEGARGYAANPELVGRTHFARYLVEHGHARDMPSAFKRYLTAGNPGDVPHQWAALGDAVSWIRASGGVAVLAHPGRYRMAEEERHALLAAFKEAGGLGLEVVTGSHTPDQFVYWAKGARRYGLHASAGSDYHGPGESYRDLGELPALPAGCTPVWRLL